MREGAAFGEFEVEVFADGERLVVLPRGELDIATVETLTDSLTMVERSGQPVLLDLGGLSFMDAAGLAALLSARDRFGHRLTLRPAPPAVQRVLVLTGTQGELPFEVEPVAQASAQASANLAHLRELWRTYRGGGAAALARQLSHRGVALSEPDPQGPVWGVSDLVRYWSEITGRPGAGGEPHGCRWETVGDHVLVGTPASSPSVSWSVYLFEGRTLIRATTFASEAEARGYATAAGRSLRGT